MNILFGVLILNFHAFDLTNFMVKWKKYRREMKLNPPTELPWLMMLSAADYRREDHG